MADGDPGDELPVYDPDAVEGPRRSTFRAPAPPPPGPDGVVPERALPAWLAVPAPVQESVEPSPTLAEPVPDPSAASAPEAVSNAEASRAQLADAPPPSRAAVVTDPPPPPGFAPEHTVVASPEPPPAPVPASAPSVADPLSATDPATGAFVRVLSAAELGGAVEAALEDGGTLAALEQFEQQLRVRGVDVPVSPAFEVPAAPEPLPIPEPIPLPLPLPAPAPSAWAPPVPVAEPVEDPAPATGSWSLADELDTDTQPGIDLPAPPPALIEPEAEPVEQRVEGFGAGIELLETAGLPVSVPDRAVPVEPVDAGDPRIDLSGFGLFGQAVAEADSGSPLLDGAEAPEPPRHDDPLGELAGLAGGVGAGVGAATAVAAVEAIAETGPPADLHVPTPADPAEPMAPPTADARADEEQRTARAASLLWRWFPLNASLLAVALGAALVPATGSLRQGMLAAFLGVALSFIPIGFATIAGKRTGAPTMVASRAVFGHRGNILPALIAVVTRVALAGALVWLAATGVAGALAPGEAVAGWIALAVVLVPVVVLALLAPRAIGVVQLALSALALVAVVGLIALTVGHVDLAAALQRPDAPWWTVVGGSVLVLCVVGLAWAMTGGDLSASQRPTAGSTAPVLAATLAAAVPAVVLIGYGALLAASDPGLGAALLADPVGAVAGLLPPWASVPFAVAVVGAFASGAIVALASAGLAVRAAGVDAARPAATTIAAVGVVIAAAVLTATVGDGGVPGLLAVLPVVAVPVAAWTGIVAGDAMSRTSPVPSAALRERGRGIPDVVVPALVGLLALTALGWALVDGVAWTGWLLPALAAAVGEGAAGADLGVLVALVLGIPVGIVVGLRAGRPATASAAAPGE